MFNSQFFHKSPQSVFYFSISFSKLSQSAFYLSVIFLRKHYSSILNLIIKSQNRLLFLQISFIAFTVYFIAWYDGTHAVLLIASSASKTSLRLHQIDRLIHTWRLMPFVNNHTTCQPSTLFSSMDSVYFVLHSFHSYYYLFYYVFLFF